ncbi:glycoside hydrolase family 1 protein [Sciscionella sediminilitoris]|uniref:glycoside hydrolase family 1 protein n=1 Tax=Sciscionella sediminilitoris TaxID=1445613 RepID=UPI0009EAC74E|nr:family 1 glycosylhydrolase [Sciscionella sp. SE31]
MPRTRLAFLALAVVLLAPFGLPSAGAEPAPFHWGVATSGYQAEGSAPDSNWSRYIAANAGTGGIDPYGNGVDFRHRYREDIRLAAGMGVNTFRFSLEWARVQPRPGVWDRRELAYYDDLVRRIRAAGMTPMITLSHFVYPGWVRDNGGFAARRTVTDFLAFTEQIVRRYRGEHVLWVTFNEPTVFLGDELKLGTLDLGRIPAWRANLVAAHRQAYDLIHRIDPGALVTSNQSFTSVFNPATDLLVLDAIKDKLDYLGIDYYYGASLDNLSAINGAFGKLWDIRLEPEGIYDALRYYANRYPGLPLYIVENGMPTDNGLPRADGYTRSAALRDSIFWVQRAKADGMNVIGYNYWSITDNYEWGSYRPRFGLYTVDARTDPRLSRRPTDAVAAYRDVIARGGVPGDYRLVRGPAFCSLDDPPVSCLHPADPNGPRARLGATAGISAARAGVG